MTDRSMPAPDALRLAPVEPTEAMLKAMDTNNAGYRMGLGLGFMRDVWTNALAAAPAVQPATGREEIARLIDPEAFVPMEDVIGMRKAYVAADRILAAISTPAQASETGGEDWRPIETHEGFGLNNSAIVAAPYFNDDGSDCFIVGEAWKQEPEGDAEPQWWWANTGPGDYHSDYIGDAGYGSPTFWRPLPAPPALSAPQAAHGDDRP